MQIFVETPDQYFEQVPEHHKLVPSTSTEVGMQKRVKQRVISNELPLLNLVTGLEVGSSFYAKLYLDVMYQGKIGRAHV